MPFVAVINPVVVRIMDAVENARNNAAMNGIQNAEFYCTTSEQGITEVLGKGTRPNVIITDPPRSGCEKKTIETILEMAPEKIIMVSCNPSTLARDLKLLCNGGYTIHRVVPLDMFPRTFHVETVVLLTRNT